MCVAGGWIDGHVLEGDFVETAEVPKHVEFVAICISPMGPIMLVFCLGEGGVGAGLGRRLMASAIASRRSVRYAMALQVVGLTVL